MGGGCVGQRLRGDWEQRPIFRRAAALFYRRSGLLRCSQDPPFVEISLLVTGDLEDIAIHALLEKYEGTRWLDVDIYQAGHHGSANGTTRPLMEAMTPSLALIAMGDPERQHQWTAWAYGHPRAVVVDAPDAGVRRRDRGRLGWLLAPVEFACERPRAADLREAVALVVVQGHASHGWAQRAQAPRVERP